MKYPCGIIQDLLPLYVDGVCNAESRQAVEDHVSECEVCRHSCEAMKSFPEKDHDGFEEKKMADSLKNMKRKMDKKMKTIILCAIAAVIAVVAGFYLLFHAVIWDVPLEKVTVSANVYPLAELAQPLESGAGNGESVTIFSDEADVSEKRDIYIPELGKITLTEKTIEKCGYVSVVSLSSDYFIREVKGEVKDNVYYISAIQTTLLNNKETITQRQLCTVEFQEVQKIVFVDADGTETMLWSRK